MRRARLAGLVGPIAGLGALFAPGAGERPTRAQHCAPPIAARADDRGWQAGLGLETARYRNSRYEGAWSGLVPEIGGHVGAFEGRAWLGAYDLERNGLRDQGIGDAGLEARWTAFHSELGAAAGAALALTLPTGDAETGLGMGHAMAMPALWATSALGRFHTGASAAFGRALGDLAGHQHGGSIVDPMNHTEVLGSLGFGADLAASLRAEATLLYAQPVLSDGAARGTGGVGFVWTTHALGLGAALHLPFAGDPFLIRALAHATLAL